MHPDEPGTRNSEPSFPHACPVKFGAAEYFTGALCPLQPFPNFTVWQFHHLAISQFGNFSISQFHSLTISQFNNFTILQFYNLTIYPFNHLSILSIFAPAKNDCNSKKTKQSSTGGYFTFNM